MLPPLLKAMRPRQWVKNVFVLAPLVFAEQLLDEGRAGRAGLAFLAFCCAASAIYLINDVRDRDDDARHPLKRHRPIASGTLSVTAACVAAGVLGLGAALVSFYLGATFAGLLAVYAVINLCYAFGLKRIVILDVMAVASGYVLRVMAGAAAIPVVVSNWLLLCTIFLALFLILTKRRHELVMLAERKAETRAVLDHYSETLLDQMINVVTASTVVSYALYCVDEQTIARFGSDRLIYSLPFVLFGVFRYLYLTYRKVDTLDPTEALLADVPFLVNVGLWGLVVLWTLYF